MRYTVSLNFGQAIKVTCPPPEWCPDAKMGRLWWFWWPLFRKNDGRFSRREVVSFTFSWLCFWFDVTFSSVRTVREELADLRRRLDVLEGHAPVEARALIYRESVKRAFGGER